MNCYSKRNCNEVGLACRGSLNLQEARIHTDPTTNNLIISASSQSVHLKAQNEIDRQQWLTALEHARHRAIKQADSEEDEESMMNSMQDVKAVLDHVNNSLNTKIDELRSIEKQLKKHATELTKFLGKTEEARQYHEKYSQLKKSIEAMVNTSEELVELTVKDSRTLTRYANNEHEQRIRLQEQIETLAKQHSNLERAAFSSSTSGEQPPYLDSDEETFVDANDGSDDFKSMENERKSGSSRQESFSDEHDAEIFNAEIVTPRGNELSLENSMTPAIRNGARKRREAIPERPQITISLWSIMRNCIGKELTKIPMPVNFNEPLSMLQRLTEDLEYAYLLDRAAEKTDPLEQICYIASYAVSSYSTTGTRTTKPFNPLLGETYECDRTDDLGWKSFTEQVSHHPPATAHHANGKKWIMHQDFTMTSRFRGKYLSVTPTGITHVKFKDQPNWYTYRKITTTVHNIIVGKLWIDNHGEMQIENHYTGDKCILKFHAYSYFSSEKPRKVSGIVKDKNGVARWLIQGYWDKSIDILQVTKQEKGAKTVLETELPRRVWTINPPYPNSEKMYHFTKLALELNEPEEGVAPTDSRLRLDQRWMEEGRWDEANSKKQELEERQRTVRKKREAEAERAMQQGLPYPEYTPCWFEKTQDESTGSVIYTFKGDYWDCKTRREWSRCPSIF
uniref:Oxysterol-binding protein n=1 Tax=Acrobeloides nanus TaxID=290746 RepID=A0A914C1C2_9BILA